MKTKISLLIVTFFVCLPLQAGLLHPYHRLALKDLDQMNELLDKKIKESKKYSSGKTVPLKEAVQAVLARPDEDSMIDKVLPKIKAELEKYGAWESSIKSLTTEALNALKNSRAFKPDVQATYAIFLENLLSELKPDAGQPGFAKKTIERIRDAKIEITKEARSERSLRMMKTPVSPSEIAEMILKQTKVEPPPATPPAESPESEE